MFQIRFILLMKYLAKQLIVDISALHLCAALSPIKINLSLAIIEWKVLFTALVELTSKAQIVNCTWVTCKLRISLIDSLNAVCDASQCCECHKKRHLAALAEYGRALPVAIWLDFSLSQKDIRWLLFVVRFLLRVVHPMSAFQYISTLFSLFFLGTSPIQCEYVTWKPI